MLCEKCGKRNATVLYTQIVNGKKSSLNICSLCASGESLFDNFGSLLSFGGRSEGESSCPVCGMTAAELTRKGRMGCGSCYDTFRTQAKSMLRKIHGTSVHNTAEEKIAADCIKKEEPAREKSELDVLKEKLVKAIAEEKYEEAAVIRDQIRTREGK